MAAVRAQRAITAMACQVRRGFRPCKQTAIATCQYCGRPFCDQHGVILEDGQEICSRDRCQRKKEDLERHLIYKREVARRNAQGLCGHLSCQSAFRGQCSKCRGYFCARHLESRDDLVRRDSQQIRQRTSMCLHCWSRRSLWSKL
jgi:predicted nucleic acid binding AN1-type Zn finger protein